MLKNPEGDRKTVVIFGGQDSSVAVDSVEFWDLETHTVEEPTDTKFLSQYSNVGSNFIKIDDYKALLFGGLSTDGSFTKEVQSFTIENGFEIGKDNYHLIWKTTLRYMRFCKIKNRLIHEVLEYL